MLKKLRNLILILLTLILIISSSVESFSANDAEHLQNTYHECSEYVSNELKNEDSAVCIGVTRPEKSTLINYLFGHELLCEKSAGDRTRIVKKIHNQSTAPEGEGRFNFKDIKQLQEALYESLKHMSKGVKNEDAVICIGATRAGKSTLINYLIGNELVAERFAKGRPITIRKVEQESIGPEIGGGSTSKTTIPTRWISKKLPNVVIWDSPGFDDNRGPLQDITNAYYLYQLLRKVKSLRIVLVVDVNDILNNNIKPFVSVLNSVEGLLGYKDGTHLSCLSVTFTKVPDTWNDAPVNMELINDILLEQFLSSNMSLTQASKGIVEFLIKNNNHISFFKIAKLGNVTPDIDVNIIPVITNSSPLEKDALSNVRPSISDMSNVYLFKFRNFLLPVKIFNDLEKVVSFIIDRKVQDLNTIAYEGQENEIWVYISRLNDIVQLFNTIDNELDLYTKINIIQSIDPDIKNVIKESNLQERIYQMVFIDKLLGVEESNQLDLSLQGVLLSSRSKMIDAINSAQLKLKEIAQQKHYKLMKEEQEKHERKIIRLRRELQRSKGRNNQAIGWLEILVLALVYTIKRVFFS